MANFSFDVDTTPMARSVDGVRGHVIGVNTAVTAMQAAVIATERDAAKKICDNVDEGFYVLVKSQISQKAVAAYTEMTSKQMTLLQLAKALDNVKRQMEGDYHMITKRYDKLFRSLNKALETRVKELDRPAIQLAETKKTVVFDKLKDDSSALFSISSETLPLIQSSLGGKLKQKTRDALLALSGSIQESNSYSKTVDSILIKNENDFSGESDARYLPAVFFVTDSLLSSGDSIENVFAPRADVWQNTAPIVSSINLTQKDMRWEVSDAEEKSKIRQEFLSLCEKESKEERVSTEIMRLFDESAWEVCKDELQ